MDGSAFMSLSPELRDALAKVPQLPPMRSMSVRRVLAPLSDVPVGTDEASPSPSSSMSPAASSSHRRAARED
ncbi:unnamed protein product [Miscanthus lutarioriparius]|uniref:Uncharacterized protein n=1 Tax=Miscanthus lutarioriparius TaxID=422564 RepID=A0A811PSP6_9POAL|nr:unnamed protein product [Miscanthus lutarioriparius]